MLICASESLQQRLEPWLDRITASFSEYDELDAWLQRQLYLEAPAGQLLLELGRLPADLDLVPTFARLHVLCGQKLLLFAEPHCFDSLPDTVMNHVQGLIGLPLSARQLELVLSQCAGVTEIREQIGAHEQRLLQLMEENRQLRSRLLKESPQDHFTGLLRRQALLDRLEDEWRRAHRHGHPISAIALRLEGLPEGEDSAERIQGFIDELALRLKAVRASDLASRFEPDLFVIVLPLTFQEGAQSLCAHFRAMIQRLADKYDFKGLEASLSTRSEQPRRHSDALRFLNETVAALDHQQISIKQIIL